MLLLLLSFSAGPLPLADFLRLEAAARRGSDGDRLPAGTPGVVLRLCCRLFLHPSGAGELGALVQPAAAAAAGSASGGGQLRMQLGGDPEVVTIPDSDEEELGTAGAADGSSAGCVPIEGVAAAVASVLADAAGQQQAQAAVAVCQDVAAHALRLLAAEPGSSSLNGLLSAFLGSLVQACRQQATAAPAAMQALAAGLTVELSPQPLGSVAWPQQQMRQLGRVAEAVNWGLSAAVGADPAAVRQRLEAALEGPA